MYYVKLCPSSAPLHSATASLVCRLLSSGIPFFPIPARVLMLDWLHTTGASLSLYAVCRTAGASVVWFFFFDRICIPSMNPERGLSWEWGGGRGDDESSGDSSSSSSISWGVRESSEEQFLQLSSEPVLWIKSSFLSQTTGAQTLLGTLSLLLLFRACHRRLREHGTLSGSVSLSRAPSSSFFDLFLIIFPISCSRIRPAAAWDAEQ